LYESGVCGWTRESMGKKRRRRRRTDPSGDALRFYGNAGPGKVDLQFTATAIRDCSTGPLSNRYDGQAAAFDHLAAAAET